VWRARIILAIAERCGTAKVMRWACVSKPCVWRWQRRFMEAGVDGLLHNKTRKHGKDRRPRPHHRRCKPRVPGVRFDPLAVILSVSETLMERELSWRAMNI
jgi:hypothetical protein